MQQSINNDWLKKLVINEQGLLFQPATGSIFIANAMGVAIIQCLQQELELADIIQKIMGEYHDIEKSIIEKDVFDFFSQMRQLGLKEHEH